MKSTITVKPKIKEFMIARAHSGYSTLDLAKASNVHYTTVQSIEKGINKIVLPKTAKKLADALGKPMEALFIIDVSGKDGEANGRTCKNQDN